MPRKPSPPIGHAVFRGKGRAPLLVREQLPDNKDRLELTVCQKFVEVLRRDHGSTLTPPAKDPSSPHDCWCMEKGRRIDIEVTEIIDDKHAAMRSDQLDYAKNISQELVDLLPRLVGLYLALDDGDQNPRYPPLASREGREIVASFVAHLRDDADALIGALPEPPFFKEWLVGSKRWRCGYWGRRVSPEQSGSAPTLGFQEGYSYTQEEHDAMLPEKIEKKVQKHYASHGDTGLLLLAYQVLGAPFAEADDPGPFIEARTLLDELLHPFTQVWYCGCSPANVPDALTGSGPRDSCTAKACWAGSQFPHTPAARLACQAPIAQSIRTQRSRAMFFRWARPL